MEQKVCFKCGKLLPLTEFYVHPQMADGHLNKCMDCTRKDVNEGRAARRDYYREYDRRRFKDAHRKIVVAKHNQSMRARFPEKYKCRTYFGNAVRDGRILRPDSCSACGGKCIPQGHHADYSKPLDVQWLCRSCHGKLHGWYKEQVV